jgi:NitT/TauT family transport system substrate-binding protein
MKIMQTRRRFLAALLSAGVAPFVGLRSSYAAEPPPETTTIRLAKNPVICPAPQYVAEEFLRAEGFTEIRYVETHANPSNALARGDVDLAMNFVRPLVIPIDSGEPIIILAGVHPGCFELFVQKDIRSVADLKGRSVGVQAATPIRYSHNSFVSDMVAHVGLDPAKDINWVTVTNPSIKPMDLFVAGKIDAFLALPPEPQELRAKNIGHVIVNMGMDKPWSQYLCCMLAGNRDFVGKYPAATKRVLRAILKATELCAADPTLVARLLVDRGFTGNYDYALQMLTEIPYGQWREYDPEDTIRFDGLRLHEAGVVKSSPQKIIAEGTDWRFLNELKRELKI